MEAGSLTGAMGCPGLRLCVPRLRQFGTISVMVPQHRRNRRLYNEPGHAHELTFSCYRRLSFLAKDRTCTWLADAIEQSRKELEYFLWAYVFMPEHVHLVICPRKPQYSVSDILRCIKQPVSRKAVSFLRQNRPEWLEHISKPRRRRTEYHFWLSGGGYDRNIVEPGTLMTMIEYIHLNPVRRGLVERAVDWKWSSAGWFAELQPNRLQPDPIPYEWVND